MGGIPCKVICAPGGGAGHDRVSDRFRQDDHGCRVRAGVLPGRPDPRAVPTLDLLVQTAQAWRLVGHRAPMVAVCSLESDPVLNELRVRTTTNPIQLALWAGSNLRRKGGPASAKTRNVRPRVGVLAFAKC